MLYIWYCSVVDRLENGMWTLPKLVVKCCEHPINLLNNPEFWISFNSSNIYIYIYIYGGPRGCKYTSISMQIIEKVNQGDHAHLANRQNQIRCFVHNGAGGHCYSENVSFWSWHLFIFLCSVENEKLIFWK